MTAIGIDIGAKIILVIKSEKDKNTAPPKKQAGNKILYFTPTILRIICGIIKPTKPIIPHIDTVKAPIKEAKTKNIFIKSFTFTPNVKDLFWSIDKTASEPDRRHKIKLAKIMTIPAHHIQPESNVAKLPTSHKKAICILLPCISAKSKTTADENKKFMASPESIIEFGSNDFLIDRR
jgi:hypothetical protein